jgi:hypothetical protein
LLTGFVVQPLHVGMISASNNFVANLDVYFNYWFGYYLLIPIIVLSIVIFFAALLFSAKKFFSSKKKINISFFPISPKQSIILVLIAAFIGGLVPLALSNESSPRYVVPVLPIIFGFVSAFFCVAVLGRLDDKAKKFFIAFLLFNLVFWVLFFNAGLLVSFLGIGMVDTVAIAYNILFFAGIFSVLAFAVFCFFKNKNFNMRVLPTLLAFAVMLWLVAFSSIVQLNELNVFYVTHYHNSTIAFQANKFLAENLPEKATVYTQQDLSWIYFLSLEAFGRKDVNLFLYAPAVSELKKGDYLVYNSRVGSGIWAVLSSDKNKFELLASFGGGFKKYLRSKLEKAELLKTGLLFSFFKDSSETMDVYVFNG